MELKNYIRNVKYYETDKMGIVHHSNHLRWFEEARVDMMNQIGFSYRQLEELGLGSPVLSASCRYVHPVFFDDNIEIQTRITSFSGMRLEISYRVTDAETGKLLAEGETSHTFTDRNGRPVRLKRDYPDVWKAIMDNIGNSAGDDK